MAKTAPGPQVNPDHDAPEELRLALVMNGGVSLAVWMGGVSTEIFRLVQGTHPVYREILALTHSSARVDVISGTSAGGINGAALALAILHGGDFKKLRDVWLTSGAFDQLLRGPLDSKSYSLLAGEDYFLPQLTQAFKDLAGGRPAHSEAAAPMDLRLTTTLLQGRQGGSIDDLGSHVHDVDYRAFFHFQNLNGVNDFAHTDVAVNSLARAARSTSSFPVAFEPSVVNTTSTDGQVLRCNLKGTNHERLQVPRCVVDGGVLDNKPFRGALEGISLMPRGMNSVRRVLAYINPDPGDGPAAPPSDKMPSLMDVTTSSLFSIPQSQAISDHLEAIQEHNNQVRTRRDSVLALVGTLFEQGRRFPSRTLERMAGDLFDVYRHRRVADTFELFVYKPLLATAARTKASTPGTRALGKGGREDLKSAFAIKAGKGWLPRRWPRGSRDPAYAADTWEWGLFPVEFGAKVMMDILRLAQSLQDIERDLPAAPAGAADAAPPTTPTGGGDWGDPDTPARAGRISPLTQAAMRSSDQAGLSVQLGSCWEKASAIVATLKHQREREQQTWRKNTLRLLGQLSDFVEGRQPAQELWRVMAHDALPNMFSFLNERRRKRACGQLAYAIADIILQICPLAIALTQESRVSKHAHPRLRDRALKLRTLAGYFLKGDEAAVPLTDARSVLYKVVQLEVIEYAFNDHQMYTEDTPIDLVQISGNTVSPVTQESVAAGDKLLGLQIAHFAAFYKRSWRANDWTFGRLDGAERLCKMLLNPDRLHRLYAGQAARVGAWIRSIALDQAPAGPLRDELRTLWNERGYEQSIADELSFLDDQNLAVPSVLAHCADVLALRLHFGILREEIPVLRDAVIHDQCQGADRAGAGHEFLQSMGFDAASGAGSVAVGAFTPRAASEQLAKRLIASENFDDEIGSDLFTRTLAHTVATTQNTLSNKESELGPLGLLFASLRLPVLGFHFVAKALARQSRTAAAFNATLLGVGMTIIALQFLFPVDGTAKSPFPATLVSVGWAMLAYGTIISVLRAPRTLGACVLLVASLAAIWLNSPWFALVMVGILVLAASLYFGPLRWLLGLMPLALAVLHSEAVLTGVAIKGHTPDPTHLIRIFAAAAVAALALAAWQASAAAKKLELAARRSRLSWLNKALFVALAGSWLIATYVRHSFDLANGIIMTCSFLVLVASVASVEP